MTFSLLLRASRANFLPASIIPFIIGASFAFNQGYKISFPKLLFGILGVASAHLAGNLMNDYYDDRSDADKLNTNSSPFFGGSKVIQNKGMTPKEVLISSIMLFFLALLSGIIIFLITLDPVILIMMLIAGILASGYTAPPLSFAYRKIGELVIFLLFGALLVMASFYIFSQKFTASSFVISLPISFLVLGVILCNEIPDYKSDILVGKRNLISLVGQERGYILYILAILFSIIAIIINISMEMLPAYFASSILMFIIGLRAINVLCKKPKVLDNYIKASQLTIVLHGLVGVALIAALLISR